MSFAFPAALWALPAAGLPLAIHLLSRRSARRRAFSDLTLLAAIEARARPRSRLREALLLAARTVLILALVLAAAGPVARGAAAAAAEDGLDLVVLLDASYSTRARDGGRARFDLARDAGRRLLKRLSPGDRVAFAAFDESLRAPLAWSDARAADAELARAVPGWRGTDAGAALAAARDLLAASPRGRRRAVLVLGDGAGHMLRGPAPPPADGAAVVGLRFPPLANAWIASVAAGPGAAGAPRLEARVGAAGGAAAGPVDLWIDGRRAGSAPAVAVAAGEARALLPLPPPVDARAPAWAGRVARPADALAEDDEFHFGLTAPAAPRVLVLFSDAQFDRAGRAGWALRALFGSGDRSLAGREADFLSAARWGEADLSRYGTVVLPDAARLPAGLSAALERFASAGGGVWAIPGADATPEELAPLSAWLPARIGPAAPVAAPGLRVLRPAPETTGWDAYALSRVSFARAFRLEPGPRSTARLAAGAGEVLLVDGPVGRGRGVVWAAPLAADENNLALKPVFVSWAAACLALTSGRAAPAPRPARVGEPLTRTWGADEAAPDRVTVVDPDGRRSTLAVRDRAATDAAVDKPGLYRFVEPDGATTAFAANLDRSRGESDLTPAASPPWTAASPDDLEAAFFAAAYGRERRGWCLAAAALALVAESALSLPAAPLAAAAGLALVLFGAPAARAQQGDRFAWTQLRLGSGWDPYPGAPDLVLRDLGRYTSARVEATRRVIGVDDPALFSSPFVYLAGTEAPAPLGDAQLRRLRQFLAGGGFLWIEDSTGGPPGSFDRWARATVAALLPDAGLKPLPADAVVERTFFLLRGPAGRVRAAGGWEGATVGGRIAVLYDRDDALGAWALDELGRPLRACVPDGEDQREIARRQTINALMYAMTGSYKADAVHQASILEKLRSVAP